MSLMRNPQKFGIQEILSHCVLFIKFVLTMKIDEILFSFECHLSNIAKSIINKIILYMCMCEMGLAREKTNI
jgi:hypothetical protein